MDRFLLLICTSVSNFALTFLTLWDFVFLLGISESLRCLIFQVYGKFFSLLIFVESMVSIERKLFRLGCLLADVLLLQLLLLLIFPPVALRPNAGHGLLILEVSGSHVTTHPSR